MTAAVPTQRRQVVRCACGRLVSGLLGVCRPCLSAELDLDVADDLNVEARDDD